MITTKRMIRILAVLCIFLFFCPAFTISFWGQNINISRMAIVTGLKVQGYYMVKPTPVVAIELIFPILIFLFAKKGKMPEYIYIILIQTCTVLDVVILIFLRGIGKMVVEKDRCTFSTTMGYIFNIVLLLVIIALTICLFMEKLKMDTIIFSFEGSAINIRTISMEKPKGSSEKTKYCTSCGEPIGCNAQFCRMCGKPIFERVSVEEYK